MSWLEDHLNDFVRPVIGHIPSPAPYFSRERVTVIKNIWRSAKRSARYKPILLAGRDVFVFEILARRENYPTVFRPDISRITVRHVVEDYSNHYLLDTGYAGSIPTGLKMSHFNMASGQKQVFPHLTGSRSLVLKIESMPKYWRRGFISDEGTIAQQLTDSIEFARAAAVTQSIYKDSSPRFYPQPKPLPTFVRF